MNKTIKALLLLIGLSGTGAMAPAAAGDIMPPCIIWIMARSACSSMLWSKSAGIALTRPCPCWSVLPQPTPGSVWRN